MKQKTQINEKIKKFLENARMIVEKEDSEWANVSKIIESTTINIDEFISNRWCDEL